jgi:hypothetical protein
MEIIKMDKRIAFEKAILKAESSILNCRIPDKIKDSLYALAIKNDYKLGYGLNEKMSHLQAILNNRKMIIAWKIKSQAFVNKHGVKNMIHQKMIIGAPKKSDKIQVRNLDILAGYTCPFAKDCKCMVNLESNKVMDSDTAIHGYCYAVKLEAIFKNSLALHLYNTIILIMNDYNLEKSLNSEKIQVIRIHSSGDFFHKKYYESVKEYCKKNPDVTIFGYTKNLYYVTDTDKPVNFKLTYSLGSKLDSKFYQLKNQGLNIPYTKVCLNHNEAEREGLKVVCDYQHESESESQDYFTIMNQESEALILH